MATVTTTVRAVTIPPKATQVDPTAASSDPYSINSFVLGTEQFHTDLADQVVADINAVGTEINAVKDEVNTSRDTAVASSLTAVSAKDTAVASANNNGDWSLLTGALSVPASVNYAGSVWVLNLNIADVTLSTPSIANTDWTLITDVSYNITSIKTSAYTAIAKDKIPIDTLTTGAFTVTLPATPSNGDYVAFIDVKGNFNVENLTVGRNGENIMGLAEDMIVSTKNISFELIYLDGNWRLS